MKREFLGDSYDLVKRFWAENLSSIAPVYADERFVPKDIRNDYTQMTRIPIFHDLVTHPFAIFLDPCTGIPRVTNTARKPTKMYAPLPFIIEVFEKRHPEFLVCFDQSFGFNDNKEVCMEVKMDVLISKGLCAFYYISHANFLFASESPGIIASIKKQLISLGIPDERLRPGAKSK
jgi:hypothetical protein